MRFAIVAPSNTYAAVPNASLNDPSHTATAIPCRIASAITAPPSATAKLLTAHLILSGLVCIRCLSVIAA
jgi:hypothetical protein